MDVDRRVAFDVVVGRNRVLAVPCFYCLVNLLHRLPPVDLNSFSYLKTPPVGFTLAGKLTEGVDCPVYRERDKTL